MPSISVVIPTYNSAAFLPAAIASVRMQCVPVHEIIVIDDGSTDETADLVRELGPGISYFRQENSGPALARNQGIMLASGDFIALLDADDLWFPPALDRLIAAFDAHPEVALVTADKSIIDSDGRIVVKSWYQRNGVLDMICGLAGEPIPGALVLLTKTNFINTSVVLIRRRALLEVGLFDSSIRYGEDLELWTRIAARFPIIAVADQLGLYRQHATNVTKNTEPMLRDLVRVMEKIACNNRQHFMRVHVDPDRLVAHAWCDLGYWHFSQRSMTKSRQALLQSFRVRPTVRAARYLAATFVPSPLLSRLREAKSGRNRLGA